MLALGEIIKQVKDVAMDVFGELKITGTYHNVQSTTHNVTSGTPTEVKVTATCTPLLVNYKESEVDGDRIQQGDEKLVFDMEQMTGLKELSTNDYFTETATGIKRYVVFVMPDPTKKIAVIQVRKTKKRTTL